MAEILFQDTNKLVIRAFFNPQLFETAEEEIRLKYLQVLQLTQKATEDNPANPYVGVGSATFRYREIRGQLIDPNARAFLATSLDQDNPSIPVLDKLRELLQKIKQVNSTDPTFSIRLATLGDS